MLEFLAPKKQEFFKAKWVSGEDSTLNGYFKFSKVKVEQSNKTSMNNMQVSTGNTCWKTKSTLPFKTDDACYFQGQKYFIVSVETDDSSNNQAHLFFRQNGNVDKIITLSKAG